MVATMVDPAAQDSSAAAALPKPVRDDKERLCVFAGAGAGAGAGVL